MSSYLIMKIQEYMFRYETETYNPELNKLLKEIISEFKNDKT